MVRMAQRYGGFDPGRVIVHVADARSFLQRSDAATTSCFLISLAEIWVSQSI